MDSTEHVEELTLRMAIMLTVADISRLIGVSRSLIHSASYEIL
jgi:hypothetical protein